MSTAVLTQTLNPGVAEVGARVDATLVASTTDPHSPGYQIVTGLSVVTTVTAWTDTSGNWSMTLATNESISVPANTVWKLDYLLPDRSRPGPVFVNLRNSPATQRVENILTVNPADLPLAGTGIGIDPTGLAVITASTLQAALAQLDAASSGSATSLKEFAADPFGNLVVNSSDTYGTILGGTATWPDGVTGVFTTTRVSVQYRGALISWTIVRGSVTYTTTVTRDASGLPSSIVVTHT